MSVEKILVNSIEELKTEIIALKKDAKHYRPPGDRLNCSTRLTQTAVVLMDMKDRLKLVRSHLRASDTLPPD